MTRLAALGAALATLSLLPILAAKPARAQQTLSPARVAPDIAITEAIARRQLSTQERAEVIAINQAQYERVTDWEIMALGQEATEIQNVQRMDPVRLADWRKGQIVSIYFQAGPFVTLEETKALLAIYTRKNPVVSAGLATKTVVTGCDIDA